MTGVPDIEELSTPDPGDWVSEQTPGGTLEFAIFAAGASLILLFTMLNFYSLPLGTVSPQSVYDNAGELYGSEIEVYGVMAHSNAQEFTLSQENSTVALEVVWLGGHSLPLNGTSVIATGQIVQGTAGPAMMCSSISVRVGAYTSYENPWVLPSLRMLAVIMLWFVSLMSVTASLLLSHLRKHTEEEEERIIALTEICTVAGGILSAALVALAVSEPKLSVAAGAFSYCVVAAFALLLTSSLAHRSKRSNVRELANPLPVIAAITVLSGLLISFIGEQLSPGVSLLSEIAAHLPDFTVASAVGTLGLIFMSAYLVRRKSELSELEGANPSGAEEGA